MSHANSPRLRLIHFVRPGKEPCWHLAEVDPTRGCVVRFVRQRRTVLLETLRAWSRSDDKQAQAQVALLERRIAELAARAALNKLLADLNLR
jgi:hypothetical protein